MKFKNSKITLQHLYDSGIYSAKELDKITKVPLRAIQRDLAKLRKGLTLQQEKGAGRPNILKANDKRRVIQLAQKDDMRSSSDIRKIIEDGKGPSVNSRTIRRCLNEAGYYCLIPKKVPGLTPNQIKKRL